ncbi:hypothetical protein B5F53_11950 [Blautia sp. An249]|uniref:hypothetical protein n=1 Tax=Blautia sp. An249 TaxID=1965603 RepID=UPI000B380E9A|nr:hypothetical protein [Blautia sp. An249]OUO77921.1 hypothetical protein B5F53_11950 [Blautia sp. An249]
MFKKLIMWLFFTIVAGVLPIGFKWVVCEVAETPFTYSSVCSEVFFFNVILAADGLKELYDVDSDKNLKVLLFASLVFIIIILSAIYGILLLNDYKPMQLSFNMLYLYSKLFTVCCLIINFSIQILGGVSNND